MDEIYKPVNTAKEIARTHLNVDVASDELISALVHVVHDIYSQLVCNEDYAHRIQEKLQECDAPFAELVLSDALDIIQYLPRDPDYFLQLYRAHLAKSIIDNHVRAVIGSVDLKALGLKPTC